MAEISWDIARWRSLVAISNLGWEIYEQGDNGNTKLDQLENLVATHARQFGSVSELFQLALAHPERDGNDAVTRWETIAAEVLNSGVLARVAGGHIDSSDSRLGQRLEQAVLSQYLVQNSVDVPAAEALALMALQEVWTQVGDMPREVRSAQVLMLLEKTSVKVRAGEYHPRAAAVTRVFYPQKLTGAPHDELIAIVPVDELGNDRVWMWLVEEVRPRLRSDGTLRLEFQRDLAAAPPAPAEQQLRHPHQHDAWQIREAPDGSSYCAACGQTTSPTPQDKSQGHPAGQELNSEQAHLEGDEERAQAAPPVDGYEILTTGQGLRDDTAWELIESTAGWLLDERENLMSWLTEKGVIERRRPPLPTRKVRIPEGQALPPGSYRIQLVFPGDTHPDDLLVQGPKALVDPRAGAGQRAYFKVLDVEIERPEPEDQTDVAELQRRREELRRELRQDLPEGLADHQNERPKRDDDPVEDGSDTP